MTRAFIYCRSATENSDSLAEQEAACRNYATAKGWDIAAIFSDTGTSGMTDRRQGLDELLERISAESGDCVVLVQSDLRLARDPKTRNQLENRITDTGAILVIVEISDSIA